MTGMLANMSGLPQGIPWEKGLSDNYEGQRIVSHSSDGDRIVYPVDPMGSQVSVQFTASDPSNGRLTTRGTLSRFRPEEDAINLEERAMASKFISQIISPK